MSTKHLPSSHTLGGRRGVAACCIGFALGAANLVLSSHAHAAILPAAVLAPPPQVPVNPTWTFWIEAGSNFVKLVQMLAFVFGAYQFWANRREARAADAVRDGQAKKDANYQAWQVVNSAQGKGGSGGRIDALADLAGNRVSLAGVNLDGSWLEGINLGGAVLTHASLRGANLQAAILDGAHLDNADLTGANLTAARLHRVSFRGADLTGARLSAASLDGADLHGVRGWSEIGAISHASVSGVQNAPAGFLAWALQNGAAGASEDDLGDSDYSHEFRAL